MPDPDLDLDLLTASLRADAGDVDSFFTVLVAKLAEALPDRTEVERSGFMGRGDPRRIELSLGDYVYEAERQRGAIECRRRSVVRGIALKTSTLELDEWLGELAVDLSAEAQRSDRARTALEGLLAP